MDSASYEHSQQPQSALVSLPAELRNRIYELVLCLLPQGKSDIVTIIPHKEVNFPGLGPRKTPTVLDLLLVCRQIHSEAEQLFYALNHLRYYTINPTFLRTLGAKRRQALTAITLNSRTADLALQEIKFNLLPLATNLRVLHLELPIFWKSDEEGLAWAREAQAALRTTTIKVVRIVHSEREKVLASLHTGGSGNNSYVFITNRAKLERAMELNASIEGTLREVDEG